ncbi:hypothetical protein [Marisediminicola senii]|uniref:hypothetical protein n=1 Tax=Marisediminicola senii TaxID=2711233 RepID=UPI0013E9F142|nr:hypothetical protein [Marisediminicola senii]
MSTITRTWLAFAAFGAGLIHLAMVVGSPIAIGITLAALGIAEFGWGILILALDRVVVPRTALVVAAAPVAVLGILVAAPVAIDGLEFTALPMLPLLAATVLGLVAAGILAVHLRTRGAMDAAAPEPGVARYLLSLGAGALVVAALTTPALAATEAGRYAQPHGEHQNGFVPPADDSGDDGSDDSDLDQLNLPEHDAH